MLEPEQVFLVERPVPLAILKRNYVRWILKLAEGNKARAARMLGVDRSLFHRWLSLDCSEPHIDCASPRCPGRAGRGTSDT